MILSGELGIGERLPSEAELARQFNVSRTTIREALRSLHAQGLFDKVPGAGGGSFVRSVDHRCLGALLQESLHDLLRLGTLGWTEVAMVRQYFEVPSARLAAVHRSDDDLELLAKIVDRQEHIIVDDYLDLSAEVGRETVRQQRDILKALEAGDPEAAETAVIEQLTYLRDHVSPDAEDGLGVPPTGA